MQGTWKTTGGGDSGQTVALAVVAAGVVIIAGGGATAAIAAVTELLTIIAVIIGVIVVAVVAVLAWWVLKGRPAGEAKAEAGRLERVHAYELEQAKADAVRHRKALEIAAASASQVNVTTTIDPAALLAAAFGAARPEPQPAWVVRAEVEGSAR